MKPLAVLIGDIHFSIPNLALASNSLQQAIEKAKKLSIPLIIGGDLIDTKANIRGEVANALIEQFSKAKDNGVDIVLLIGNHDRINEKNPAHSLNFLRPYVKYLIDEFKLTFPYGLALIPYQNSSADFLGCIKWVPRDVITITHIGLKGANMGHYYKDESSTDPSELAGRRIISFHYHQKHDIVLPENGLWSYGGAPYTITASEAFDGPKGFCVLYSDGSLEQIPTNLRKHVVVERTVDTVLDPITNLNPEDLLWIKVSGSHTELDKLDKKKVGNKHLGHQNFKLDKIYSDRVKLIEIDKLSNVDIMDSVVDNTNESINRKEQLKYLWREVLSDNSKVNSR